MRDYDYDDAKEYVEDCFKIERRRLDAMHRSLNTGTNFYNSILSQKETSLLSSVILETALLFALSALTGGVQLTKHRKKYKKNKEVLIERLEYVESTIKSAGLDIKKIRLAAKTENKDILNDTVAGSFISGIEKLLSVINQTKVNVNAEESIYKEFLKLQRNSGKTALTAMVKKDILKPPAITASELDGMPIAFLYQLLSQYASKRVRVEKIFREGFLQYDKNTLLVGFNNNQEKLIYEYFSRKKLAKYKLDNTKIRPIESHKDMVKYWKVKEVIKRVRQPKRAVTQW